MKYDDVFERPPNQEKIMYKTDIIQHNFGIILHFVVSFVNFHGSMRI